MKIINFFIIYIISMKVIELLMFLLLFYILIQLCISYEGLDFKDDGGWATNINLSIPTLDGDRKPIGQHYSSRAPGGPSPSYTIDGACYNTINASEDGQVESIKTWCEKDPVCEGFWLYSDTSETPRRVCAKKKIYDGNAVEWGRSPMLITKISDPTISWIPDSQTVPNAFYEHINVDAPPDARRNDVFWNNYDYWKHTTNSPNIWWDNIPVTHISASDMGFAAPHLGGDEEISDCVYDISISQAMRACNENPVCAGFTIAKRSYATGGLGLTAGTRKSRVCFKSSMGGGDTTLTAEAAEAEGLEPNVTEVYRKQTPSDPSITESVCSSHLQTCKEAGGASLCEGGRGSYAEGADNIVCTGFWRDGFRGKCRVDDCCTRTGFFSCLFDSDCTLIPNWETEDDADEDD